MIHRRLPNTGHQSLLHHEVGHYHGSHGFQYWWYPQRNAQIVSSFYRKTFHFTGFPVQCELIFWCGRCRLDSYFKIHFVAIGYASDNATSMVGFGAAIVADNGIVVLYTKHVGGSKTGTK